MILWEHVLFLEFIITKGILNSIFSAEKITFTLVVVNFIIRCFRFKTTLKESNGEQT